MSKLPSSFPHAMYTPPGANPNELGDITVIDHAGQIHLFHLTLPNHDVVAHAVSDDGITFQPVASAIHIGAAGECDDDMIWTMHVIRHPRRKLFHMYYTGCSLAENGQFQRVALATSTDLSHWRKHPGNPVLEPRPPHYNNDLHRVGFVSFRDPFVFVDERGLWHMLVTGRTPTGSRFRSGCVVHATSKDGLRWQLQKPLYAPSHFEDLEVASYLRNGDRHAIFFNHFLVCDGLCRVANSLDGPWVPPTRELLLPRGNVVFRFCQWKGRTLLYHWLMSKADWSRRGGSGATFFALPAPKEVEWDNDGNPALRSFSGWSRFHRGRQETLTAASFRSVEGDAGAWRKSADGSLLGSANGQAIATHRAECDHFSAEFTLTLVSGRAAGLVFRGDDRLEIANLLRFDYNQQTVELHKWDRYDSSHNRFKSIQPTLLQSLPAKLTHGVPVHVSVLACCEYIEVSLDGIVYLCASTYRAQRGRFGWLVENGAAVFSDLRVQPLRVPQQP